MSTDSYARWDEINIGKATKLLKTEMRASDIARELETSLGMLNKFCQKLIFPLNPDLRDWRVKVSAAQERNPSREKGDGISVKSPDEKWARLLNGQKFQDAKRIAPPPPSC